MIDVVGNELVGFELVVDGMPEPICVVEDVATVDEAVDAFAANHFEHTAELDELLDLIGRTPEKDRPKRSRVASGVGGKKEKKRGSGARFRELMVQGKSNEECLKIVREEFPDSKATLSDAAWNRAELKKNPGGYQADGRKV